MNSELHGWCGRILKIDLSTRNITHLNTMDYADRFLGGRGIATRLYWPLVPPQAGALDPENCLIWMTGPLGAVGVSGATRFEIVGKSPMRRPEGFCYGNLGGYFGPYLKRAGYDGLVVTGRSDKPAYLWIGDDAVKFMDASDLWGQGVYAVGDRIKQRHGRNARFVTTGVAGENQCRCANVMTDNEGSATGGFGAVMGSKNLKAVVVQGSGHPAVADPEKLKALNQHVIALNRRGPLFSPFPKEQVFVSGKASCYQCGLDCVYRGRFETASGQRMVRKCQAMFVYFPWVMARSGESAETAVAATGICNDLSLCTMEMYNIVQWLQDAFAAGDLTEAQTGLDISKLGTLPFFEKLAHMIAYRQGFGEILAEGLLRAGDVLGESARSHFSEYVAAVGDGASYSAREYPMNGLLYALEPRQPIAMLHEVSRLVGMWVMHQDNPQFSPVSSSVFRAAARTFWKHESAWDLTTCTGKAMAAVQIANRTLVKDSLGLCDSAWPLMVSAHTPDHLGDPTLESRLFQAVTGINTDEAGLNSYGDRIFNLQRAILLREGRQAPQDDMPAEFNFTTPVQTVFMNPDVIVPGPDNQVINRKGQTLNRDDYLRMRQEYYTLRGWHPDSGLPKTETLNRLDLGDVGPLSLVENN